jgi:phage terminase small subunit
MPKPNETLDITIKKEISPLVTKAQDLIINDQDHMLIATDLLSKLNQFNDRITEEKEKVTKPANEILKAERARWKPLETMYETAISKLRSAMSSYQTEQIKREKQEAEKIASRVGEGKGKLKIETAVKQIDAIEKVDAKVVGDAGMVKFRTVPKLKIIDISKIPHAYFDLNESRLLADLKKGIKVIGAEIEEIQQPINFR